MLVACWSLSSFTFDRKTFTIIQDVFPDGRYERQARLSADPMQIDVIAQSLRSLRILSVLDFFTRVDTNLMLCFRFHNLISMLRAPEFKQYAAMYPWQRRLALVFFAIPILLTVFVYKSIATSDLACSSHPECVTHAQHCMFIREGDFQSQNQCLCLILVDQDRVSVTYEAWVQPKDVTTKITQLAVTGDLQTIQLVNWELPELPVELRRCTNLKHVSLYYTDTERVPSWFKEFKNFVYFRMEGKCSGTSLEALPEDLFDNMQQLTFIHLAAHLKFQKLPSFKGSRNLRVLPLVVLLSLKELPDFADLPELERLVLAAIPLVTSVSDMAGIKNLKSFAVLFRSSMCCNGFLNTKCDLGDYFCQPWLSAVPSAACLAENRTDHIATRATLRLFAKFADSVCSTPSAQSLPGDTFIDQSVRKCNGTMFAKCQTFDGVSGMCYSSGLEPIVCTPDPYLRAMRERQVEMGVGAPCDPVDEAWVDYTA